MQQITFSQQSVLQRLLVPTTVPWARNLPANHAKITLEIPEGVLAVEPGEGFQHFFPGQSRGRCALSAPG